jgi:hypothetical protein
MSVEVISWDEILKGYIDDRGEGTRFDPEHGYMISS